MKEEESRCVAVVKAFELVEKKSQELNTKLAEAERDKKSTEAALDGVERQAEAQCKQFRQAEDELSTAKSQIKVLTKKLEEAEKAKEQTDQAEQDVYDVGVAKTEEALKVEVSKVSRFYCLQVWNEALDQAGVEASSTLRRAKSVYYPPVICSSGSKANMVSKEADEGKESPTKALPTTNIPPKEAKQFKDAEKAVDTEEVAHNANLPPAAPKDPSKEKEASYNMEIVLATLPILTKEDLKGKGLASSTQPPKILKDNLIIKMKP